MKKQWLHIIWDVIRFGILIVISIVILNNAPQLMNESSWLYYWMGLVLQIFGFILLGYSFYDGYKSVRKYYEKIKEMVQ